MKHLSKLAAILAALVLACAFFGCSDGSDGNSINGNQSISLSDGDYTFKIKQSADEWSKKMISKQLQAIIF